ncbi:MAG TPA: hypothetical protein DCS93_05860 [Microscillaceae bacterium]|nr:hypothetical protein [Microscillaceae bacterium]
MSWRYKITGVIVVFVSFIMFLVVKAMRQDDIHLVAKDYYKQEIEYQNEINKLRNVQNLKESFNLEYVAEHQMFRVKFPKSVTKGEIMFFRPSDARKDFKIPVEAGQDGVQLIPMKDRKMDKGFWRLKIDWQDAQKKYYVEKRIVVGKNGQVEIQS